MKDLLRKIVNFLEPDKSLHIMLSMIILIGLFTFTNSLFIATIVTILVGLFKEFIWDRAMKMGTYNVKDIYANLVGIVIGIVVCCLMIVHANIYY